MRQCTTTAMLLALLAGCNTSHTQRTSTASKQPNSTPPATADVARSTESPTASSQRRIDTKALLPQVWNAQQVQTIGVLETVATFDGPMPTGVTISRQGRIFINFPKWGDTVQFTVAELKDGKPAPYPSAEINREDRQNPRNVLVSVQSVVVDPKDRLWILDTGSERFGSVVEGGAKLVCVDLASNKVVNQIIFPREVAREKSYLNDVRFDLRKGKAGYAFITDSSTEGENGIIVVDLDSGKSWRRLNDHPSTKAEKQFIPVVEGQQLMMRPTGGKPAKPITFGSDGIAISADGAKLYYCPLATRKLYSVSTGALIDQSQSDDQVARTIEDLGEKCASDGLETDSENRLYATDYESAAIRRRTPDGRIDVLVQDPRMIWPDTLSLAADGYLYVTINQLDRMDRFHEGKDMRTKPYALCRVKVDAQPVRLVK